MNKNVLGRLLSLFLLLFLFVLVPSINVNAEIQKSFSVYVETDKTEYTKGDTVTYKITVKNISGKDSEDLVIQNTLAKDVAIVETDGKIEGQTIHWEKEQLKRDEELILNLKVKLENGENIEIKPTIPDNKPGTGLPEAGGTNSLILITIGLLLSIGGVFIYKRKGKKSTTALFLAFTILISMIGTNGVYASELTVNDDFKFETNIGERVIINNITISAKLIEYKSNGDTTAPIVNINIDDLNLSDDGTYLIEEKFEGLSGSIIDDSQIIELTYKVVYEGEVIKEASVESNKEFLITEIPLLIGKNEVVITAKDSNSNEGSTFIILTNISTENILGVDIDKIDTDGDGDGLTDFEEKLLETDINKVDTDNDGLVDNDEVLYGTLLDNQDTDDDGLSDGDEIKLGLDPLKKKK